LEGEPNIRVAQRDEPSRAGPTDHRSKTVIDRADHDSILEIIRPIAVMDLVTETIRHLPLKCSRSFRIEPMSQANPLVGAIHSERPLLAFISIRPNLR
jgi:hypothetical protein